MIMFLLILNYGGFRRSIDWRDVMVSASNPIHLQPYAEQALVGLIVGALQLLEDVLAALVDLRRHLREPEVCFSRFDLAEEGPDALELMLAPGHQRFPPCRHSLLGGDAVHQLQVLGVALVGGVEDRALEKPLAHRLGSDRKACQPWTG